MNEEDITQRLAHKVKVADDKRFFLFRVGNRMQKVFVRRDRLTVKAQPFTKEDSDLLRKVLGPSAASNLVPLATLHFELTGEPEQYDSVTQTSTIKAPSGAALRHLFGLHGRDFAPIQVRNENEEALFHCMTCGYKVDFYKGIFKCFCCGADYKEDPRTATALSA